MALPASAEPGAPDTPIGPALLKAAGLAVVLVGAGLLLRPLAVAALHDVHNDARGAAILILTGGLATALGLPRQVLAFSAAFVFGAPAGIAWAMLGQMLGCALDYAAARNLVGNWARRHFAGRWRRLDRFIIAQPFTATLTLRLLPVGNNVALNLLAGVSGISPAAFLAASCIGYLPQTLIFALLGSGVHVGQRQQITAGLLLFIASAALGVLLWRRAKPPA